MKCQPCIDRDYWHAKAEALVQAGTSPDDLVVRRAMGMAAIAEFRADHQMNLANHCPHETEPE